MTVEAPINPAAAGPAIEADRIPMSVPTLKLAVPAIPDHYIHWFRDEPGRIAQALRAGYQFVEDTEVSMPGGFLGSDTAESRNGDMGTRVSMLAGGTNSSNGQAQRLYLMKLPKRFRDQDLAKMADTSESIAQGIIGGTAGGGGGGDTAEDRAQRYVKKSKTPDLFKRKKS